jgi:hypothetical protein
MWYSHEAAARHDSNSAMAARRNDIAEHIEAALALSTRHRFRSVEADPHPDALYSSSGIHERDRRRHKTP